MRSIRIGDVVKLEVVREREERGRVEGIRFGRMV